MAVPPQPLPPGEPPVEDASSPAGARGPADGDADAWPFTRNGMRFPRIWSPARPPEARLRKGFWRFPRLVLLVHGILVAGLFVALGLGGYALWGASGQGDGGGEGGRAGRPSLPGARDDAHVLGAEIDRSLDILEALPRKLRAIESELNANAPYKGLRWDEDAETVPTRFLPPPPEALIRLIAEFRKAPLRPVPEPRHRSRAPGSPAPD